MIVRVVETTIAGTQKRVLASFDNFIKALNYGVRINNGKQPLRVDKFTFFWDYSDKMIFTEIENFYQFRVGSIVQSNNNISPIRFTDAKVIQCFVNGLYPMYQVRFEDGSVRTVREIDIRIQRL